MSDRTTKLSLRDARTPQQISVVLAEAAAQGVQFEDLPYPYDEPLPRKEYEKKLRLLQIELVKAQRWIKESGDRLVVFFEGRDGAGKGGTIQRFTEHLNPRGVRVVALSKPNETERAQWYFQRYISQMPTGGEMALFDRSWYNRAGVEPVLGFCSRDQYSEFLRQAPVLERSLINSGILFVKIWLAVGRKEQKRRIESRRKDPLKQWKLSPIDSVAMEKYDDYTRARDIMFARTHTTEAPWTVIRSDDQRRARLSALRHVLNLLPYDSKDQDVLGETDLRIVGVPLAVPEPDESKLFNGKGDRKKKKD